VPIRMILSQLRVCIRRGGRTGFRVMVCEARGLLGVAPADFSGAKAVDRTINERPDMYFQARLYLLLPNNAQNLVIPQAGLTRGA
jgi:hypothetical protein